MTDGRLTEKKRKSRIRGNEEQPSGKKTKARGDFEFKTFCTQ